MTALDSTARDLVAVDEAYDREFASDGVSRYGAYLRARAHLFADEGTPPDAVAFTILAWQIANSPVMSPGYVQLRPDVHAITCRDSEEPRVLVADLEVRLRWPTELHRSGTPAGWRTWVQEDDWSDQPPAMSSRVTTGRRCWSRPTCGCPFPRRPSRHRAGTPCRVR